MGINIDDYMKLVESFTKEVPSSAYSIAYGQPELNGFKDKIEPKDLPAVFENRQNEINRQVEEKIESQPVQKELLALLSESNHPLASAALERILMLEVQLEDMQDLMDQQRDNFKEELEAKQKKMNKIKAQAEKSNLRSYLATRR